MKEFSSTKKLRLLKSKLFCVSSGSITAIVRAINADAAEKAFVSSMSGKPINTSAVTVKPIEDREGVIYFNNSRDY